MSKVATSMKGKRKQPSRRAKATLSGIFGALIGVLGGGLVGASLDNPGSTVTGALVGAILLGFGEGITDFTRQRGRPKPLAYRIVIASLGGAVFGGILSLVFSDISLAVVGLLIGLLSGARVLNWWKTLLGASVGLLLGWLAATYWPQLSPAGLGAMVVFLYRSLIAGLFNEVEPIQIAAERVPAEQIRYVVPFEANSLYIGADYFRDLARAAGGAFARNAEDIGIVETMESLRGPYFDPALIDPLIREFYEHTSRFTLSIIPVWRRRIKPFFWLYKRLIAQPIGQANLPFNQEEAQRGVVSYIDTIDFECDDIIDLRGWVRAFEETGEAIYVGVYTTFRHENIGYVSVGFPLPDSNLTATLLPYNQGGSNFLLRSRQTGLPYPGHYLSTSEQGRLTVLSLPLFNEEIEVYVENGHLKTDHRFFLGDILFLTLYYSIERARVSAASTPAIASSS